MSNTNITKHQLATLLAQETVEGSSHTFSQLYNHFMEETNITLLLELARRGNEIPAGNVQVRSTYIAPSPDTDYLDKAS